MRSTILLTASATSLLLSGCASEFERRTEGTVPQFCYATLSDVECFAEPLAPEHDSRFSGIYLRPEEIGPTNQQWLALARDDHEAH